MSPIESGNIFKQSVYRDILRESSDGVEAVEAVADRLGADMGAGVLIAYADGKIAANRLKSGYDPFDRQVGDSLDEILADSLEDIRGDVLNVPMSELPVRTAQKNDIKDEVACVLPLNVFGRRTGTMLVYRQRGFSEEDMRSCMAAVCLSGAVMESIDGAARLENERKKETVRVVTDSMSYSELMVSGIIFRQLEGGEGIIVASRIADEEGITRSVIVNAIRKLESAGVLESRSLGMKGTYIKILNEYFSTEIAKIEK